MMVITAAKAFIGFITSKWGMGIMAALAVIAGALWLEHRGYERGQDTTTAHYEALLADMARERASLEATYREQERANIREVQTITDKYLEQIDHETQSLERTIADLRAGNRRLRERFTCTDTGTMPGVSTGIGGDNERSERGLQRADAEFLVSIAAEADRVTRQLQACQRVIAADRYMIGDDPEKNGSFQGRAPGG